MSYSEKPAAQPGKFIIVLSVLLAVTGWIQFKDIQIHRPPSRAMKSELQKTLLHCKTCREAGPDACAEDFGEGKTCGPR